jgi:hypothetical protein
MAAEGPSAKTTSGGPRAAPYDAIRRAPRRPPEEERTAPAAAPLVLKGAGVVLLVIAGLVAVYLGAGFLGELAASAAYP